MKVEYLDEAHGQFLVALWGAKSYRGGVLAFFRYYRDLIVDGLRKMVGPYDLIKVKRVRMKRDHWVRDVVLMTVDVEVYRAVR